MYIDGQPSATADEPFLRQAWNALHPAIRRWVPETQLRQALASSIADALGRIRDMATATAFHDAMPVTGATPEEYRVQLLDAGRGRRLVAGIRFRTDRPFSFVEVYARDFPIDSAPTVMTMLDVTRRAFAVFAPTYLRLHVAADSLEDQVVEQVPGSPDFYTVAGLVRALQGQPHPPQLERVHLAPVRSMACYDRYLAEYRAFHEANPDLRDLVPEAPLADLDDCGAHGLLFDVVVDDTWAGVIAGRPHTDYGMPGYSIVEELLRARFRGVGLGAALRASSSMRCRRRPTPCSAARSIRATCRRWRPPSALDAST